MSEIKFYLLIGICTFLLLKVKHYTEELFNYIWACRQVGKGKYISEEDNEFELEGIWTMDLDFITV